MIQVQGRFMEEVVLELMISANDSPKYKVAQSPLTMGQEKILYAVKGIPLGEGKLDLQHNSNIRPLSIS